MADNARGGSESGTAPLIAADEVTYSGDTAKVQLVRLVNVTGSEGSRAVEALATGVQYAEDAAIPTAGQGTLVVGRRDDALTTLSEVEGDAIGLRVNSKGALWVAQEGGGSSVSGDVAHDAADSGNPVKIGGKASSAAPTTVAAGDRTDAWFSLNGAQMTSPVAGEGNGGDGATAGLWSARGGGTQASPMPNSNYVYNGSTWDRMRGNTSGTFVHGEIAHDAADSGNPVKIGGVALDGANAQALVGEGDRVHARFDQRGGMGVRFMNQNGSLVSLVGTTTDGQSTHSTGQVLPVSAYGWAYSGSVWDRVRSLAAFDAAATTPRTGLLAAQAPDHRYNSVNLGTAADSVQAWESNGVHEVLVRLGTTTTGTMVFEVTADGANWVQASTRDTQTGLWASAAFTPTSGKTYRIVSAGWRSVRARTVTTLGATVALVATAMATESMLNALDTGPAPHSFGYAELGISAEYTTTQTSTVLGPTVSSTQRMVVTSIQIHNAGTTAGNVQVYFGTGAFARGTSKPIFDGGFGTTAHQGYAQSKPNGWIGALDEEVRVTTSAAINPLRVSIWYYLV